MNYGKSFNLLMYIEGRTYHLKEDVIGATNKKLYGKDGESVKLVSVSVPACVVENINGDLYATNVDNLC